MEAANNAQADDGTTSPLTWDKKKVLGKGSFGDVFQGKLNGQDVAVKVVDTTDLDPDFHDREERAMKEFDHPNVLKLLYVMRDRFTNIFALELCVATVLDYCNSIYTGKMPTDHEALMQMTSGLAYIHSKKFVHRDIKPGNVLISQEIVLKISDFGFCKPVSSSGSFSTNSGPKGTRVYYAPEWLQLEEKDSSEREHIRANVTIDIFALGVVFFKYLTKGKHPFANPASKSHLYIPANILDGKTYLESYEGMSRRHYAFPIIQGMIQADPKNRWGLDRVLEELRKHAPTSVPA